MGNPKPPTTPVSSTPTRIGGKERRAKVKLWRNLAESSARINLLRVLIKDGIGFNEIEEFEMGLQSKFRSTKFKNIAASTRQEGKVKEQAMKRKLADEQCYYRELVEQKKKARKEISKKLKNNSKPYRKFMKMLGQEEKRKKSTMTDKFKKKTEHLRKKYCIDKNKENMTIPSDVSEFKEAIVFDKNKFDKIEDIHYEIKVIGNVEISGQEERILKLHPKFCIAGLKTRSSN